MKIEQNRFIFKINLRKSIGIYIYMYITAFWKMGNNSKEQSASKLTKIEIQLVT